MVATTGTRSDVPDASPRLRFDVIDKRAAELLGVSTDELTVEMLAELLGIHRTTLWRQREGHFGTSMPTARKVATALRLPVDDVITESSDE